jgi:hypothetical protein
MWNQNLFEEAGSGDIVATVPMQILRGDGAACTARRAIIARLTDRVLAVGAWAHQLGVVVGTLSVVVLAGTPIIPTDVVEAIGIGNQHEHPVVPPRVVRHERVAGRVGSWVGKPKLLFSVNWYGGQHLSRTGDRHDATFTATASRGVEEDEHSDCAKGLVLDVVVCGHRAFAA